MRTPQSRAPSIAALGNSQLDALHLHGPVEAAAARRLLRDGPEATRLATDDPQWWTTLWQQLLEALAPQEQAPWMQWLAQPATGPTGAARTWGTFAQGVATLSQLHNVPGTVPVLLQWLAWHGNGRLAIREAVQWPTPTPPTVWDNGSPDDRAAVVTQIAHVCCLDIEGLAAADAKPLRVVLGNVPLRELGWTPTDSANESWEDLVRLLAAPLGGAAPPMNAWASSDTLRAVGVGGWLNRWLTPYTTEMQTPQLTDVAQQQHDAQLLLDGLGLRPDWPSGALAVLLKSLGPESITRLTIQERLPRVFLTAITDDLAKRLATGPLQPNGHLKLLARVLHQVPASSDANPSDQDGRTVVTMQPEDLVTATHALRIGLTADQALTTYGKARGSFAQVGVDIEQSPFYRELERLLGDPRFVATWDKDLLRMVLSHPRQSIRERLVRTLARIRPGGPTPPQTSPPAPPPREANRLKLRA